MSITTELKRSFYSRHFEAYFDFLNGLSLNSDYRRTAMNITINAINERCNHDLFKMPYFVSKDVFSVKNPREAAASVEEFFKILETDKTVQNDVSNMLKFLRDPSGAGTVAEMINLSEDRILRAICFYFWDRKGRKALKATDKQLEWIEMREKNYPKEKWDRGDYQYEKYENKDYAAVINGPLRSLLGNDFDDFQKFLNLVRKIRNMATHKGSFFIQAEGYQVYRFILFTYMTTVLMIRRAQFQDEPFDKFPEMKLSFDKLYHNINLFEGENESPLPLLFTEDGRCYYQVRWYKDYRLVIDDKSIVISLTCNDWEPEATKDDNGIRTYSNTHQVDNDAHCASFHQAMDALEKAVVELHGISQNTKDISNIYDILKKDIDQQESQNKNLEEISGFLKDITQALQKDQKDGDIDLGRILGPQHEALTEVLNNQKRERERNQRNESTITEIRDQQKQEREERILHERRKDENKDKILFGLLIGSSVIAAVACVWHGMRDLSLQWLTHQWVYIVVTAAILGGGAFIGAYLSKNWKNKQPTWKRWLPAEVALLTCALVAGTYFLIPALNYNSFVKKYDFAKHVSNENKAAVVYMKGHSDLTDEATLKQLATYYYRYADSVSKAKKYAMTLSDVKRYPEGCLVAAEVLLASGDYSQVTDVITDYNKHIGNSHPVLERIAGLQCLKGWGKEKSPKEAFNLLKKAADAGDVDAIYYLGHMASHDYTNWHEGEVESKVEAWLFIHLPLAAYYFQIASSHGHPRASLQLGKLYADVNMNDSAKYYYQKAMRQCEERPGQLDSERIRQAALFQTGLVCVSEGDSLNDYIRQAQRLGYEPAILYSALLEKDHVTAIERYRKAGIYKGYRYIPPVVFEYLAIGDSVSALETLVKAHPNGHFNMDFVRALQLIEGNEYVKKDSIQWLQQMRKSAENGCQFAQLCYSLNDEIFKERGTQQKIEACTEVPFGHAVESLYYEHYFDAVAAAAKALSHGQPVGAVAFFSMNHMQQQDVMPQVDFLRWKYGLSQQIARMVSNQHMVDSLPSYKHTALEFAIAMFREYLNCAQLDYESYELHFWGDVAMANHLFYWECVLASNCKSIIDSGLKQELLSAAVADASPEMGQEDLTVLSILIQKSNLQEQLGNRYKGDDFRYHLIYPQESFEQKDYTLGKGSGIYSAGLTGFSSEDLVHEFSNKLDDYYEFALREDEMIIPGIKDLK